MLDDDAMARNQAQIERVRKQFEKLIEKIKDLSPVFSEFVPIYQKIIETNFEAKGKVFERERWIGYANPQGLQPAPRIKYKQTHGYGSLPMLEITGNLKNKTINFDRQISKDKVTMSVKGEDYLFWVSDREPWGRKTFYTKDYDMPIQAWRIFIEICKKQLTVEENSNG
jgi:hypothetical protein